MRTVLSLFCAIGALLAVAAPAQAQWNADQEYESKLLSDRWNIYVGGFRPEFTTEFAISSGSVLGSLIRLEDTLGLEEDVSTVRTGGFYRFSKKRAIAFDISSMRRDATRTIDETITIGEGEDEIVFDVGALVESEFDNDILTITYRHSFINNGKTEAGFTAGASTYAVDFSATGTASINGGPPETATGDESLIIPVPAFGMFVNHAFTENWILRMYAGFLNLNVGDFEGRYLITSVSIDWIFTKHFGLGAGLSRSDVSFKNTGGDNPYNIEYRLGGPSFYASLVF
jgi:hypothetical protein